MKKLLSAALMFLLVSICLAVPANPELSKVDQGNGATVTLTLKGDESVHWSVTNDGYTVLRNKDGKFEYAIQNNSGDLIPSGMLAKDYSQRSVSEITYLNSVPKNQHFSTSQINIMKKLRKEVYEPNKGLLGDGKTKATKNIILILAAFKDKAFTKTKSDFENLMNQIQTDYTVDGATGSFKKYYQENSYGTLTFETTVAGPFTAAQNMSYYGANDASGNDVKPEELVTEVVNLANPTVDFSLFDNDNNGSVDVVYVIYAGYGEENQGVSANAIWAHAYSIPTITCDGKTVSKYSCSSELRGTSGTGISRIGVICHEFGHALGAPDYYDTNYDQTGDGEYPGTGEWDMMASGSWNNGGATPAHHNAYTKTVVYGWATSTVLSTGATITMQNSEQNSNSFYRYNTPTTNEYFLLENRQPVGFDTDLPGHGMIIYRVDGSYISSHSSNNTINTTSHQGMYPMAANHTIANGISIEATANPIHTAGCPWPGSSNKTTFTDATTPNSKSWAAANTAKPLTNITENTTNKTVIFTFMGGPASAIDAGITSITTPVSGPNLTSAETVTAVIKNFGSTSIITGLTVSYKIDNGAAVNETYTGSAITTGTSVNFTFAQKANLSAGGSHTVQVYTTLTDDGDATNNSTTVTVENVVPSALPLSESFENATFVPTGWSSTVVQTAATAPVWSRVTAGTYPTCSPQNLTAMAKFNSYNCQLGAKIRLATKAFTATGKTGVTLNFFMYHDNGSSTTADNIQIQYSLDGTNWTNAGSVINRYAATNGWTEHIVTLAACDNQANFYVGFLGQSAYGNNIFIDNVNITTTTAGTAPTATTSAATLVNAVGALLNGSVNASNASTTVTFEYGLTTSYGQTVNADPATITGSTNTAVTATLTGLAGNTLYNFRVKAVNSYGTTYGLNQTFTTSSVSTSLSETFEDNSPTRALWTQENISTSIQSWTFATGSGGGAITTAHSGTKNARYTATSTPTDITKLITPVLDISSLTTPKLNFWYGQENWEGDQNNLKIYYRTNSGAAWVEIFSSALNIATWTEVLLDLPAKSSTYQIAFEGTDNYGHANVLDDVEISGSSSIDKDPLPQETSLSQNYPNPFNPETAINFALSKDASINLTIYNAKGEIVKTLINKNYSAGYHSVSFDATGLNSGVYIYKLATPEQSLVKKMLLVK